MKEIVMNIHATINVFQEMERFFLYKIFEGCIATIFLNILEMNLMRDKNFIDDLPRKWTLRENPYILFVSVAACLRK